MTDCLYQNDYISIEEAESGFFLRLKGVWNLATAEAIDGHMSSVVSVVGRGSSRMDCSAIESLDTAGAILVRRYVDALSGDCDIDLSGVSPAYQQLFDVVSCRPPQVSTDPKEHHWFSALLEAAGAGFITAVRSIARVVGFQGLVLIRLSGALFDRGRIRFVPILYQLESVGINALGIVGLISFLIGAVIVNQGAIQFAKFGADIFVIDMLGIIQLRELGALLPAIIVAGRSGSAFAAQIGSMKLNEEIDAIRTIGMNPIDVLVLPRLIALLISLPLLVFYSDIIGIVGGMMMAWGQLDISPGNFLVYFRDAIDFDHYLVGLIKAPFFAVIISSCGCYQGLQVKGSADSLGERTTRSVVQAIFLVIVVDALFAMFFTALDM